MSSCGQEYILCPKILEILKNKCVWGNKIASPNPDTLTSVCATVAMATSPVALSRDRSLHSGICTQEVGIVKDKWKRHYLTQVLREARVHETSAGSGLSHVAIRRCFQF